MALNNAMDYDVASMVSKHQPQKYSPEKRDLVREGHELGNTSRNERQKSVFLCEVGRIRRQLVSDAIDTAKQISDQSKKLCQRSTPELPSRRTRAS